MSGDSDTIRLDLPASHKYLNVLGACIGELLETTEPMPDMAKVVYTIQLAIHEACTNIIDHAYKSREPGRIHISLTLIAVPRQLVVELVDTGTAFDPALVPEPNLAEGQERGYGLFLMKEILDEVTYDAQPGANRWRLTKYL